MAAQPVFLNQVGLLCAVGSDIESLSANLNSQHDFMTRSAQYSAAALPLGMVNRALPPVSLDNPCWHSRNNQFAEFAYQQIQAAVAEKIHQYGAQRVGVVIGSSTSGISDAETAIAEYQRAGKLPDNYHYSIQEMGNCAAFIAALAGAKGPVYAVSTACSSGAKALVSAQRLINAGLCDVVIAGGVDTLCQLTVQGFSALEAVSHQVCNPFSRNRDGINIGEAAALFVVSAEPAGVRLAGAGESSDAYHISAPEPEGLGAEACMRAALKDAQITAGQIDYINLHGTATQLNDEMESRAVFRVFGGEVPASSTKPVTGHTLGAAGAIEAAIGWVTLTGQHGLPRHCWDGQVDPSLPPLNLVDGNMPPRAIRRLLSNSFAFGGNNIALVLERL